MATAAKTLTHIEMDQGVGHGGKTFGYDHKRSNFIIWEFADGKIVPASVEHDEQEDEHGSLGATLRDAKSVAARENRLPSSRLRQSMEQEFRRD
jgi:major membrane immunogen (membrane-anchored lipoprotein)